MFETLLGMRASGSPTPPTRRRVGSYVHSCHCFACCGTVGGVFWRRFLHLLTIAALTAACTSATESATSTPTPIAPASSAVPTPAAQVSGGRITLKLPGESGSFLVRGLFPKSTSSCKHVHRATLKARYPGTLSITSADDGSLSIMLTLPFERYLEGLAEVPPTVAVAPVRPTAV